MSLCEPNACGRFLREFKCFVCRKQILTVWIHWTELFVCWVPVAPLDIKYIDYWLTRDTANVLHKHCMFTFATAWACSKSRDPELRKDLLERQASSLQMIRKSPCWLESYEIVPLLSQKQRTTCHVVQSTAVLSCCPACTAGLQRPLYDVTKAATWLPPLACKATSDVSQSASAILFKLNGIRSCTTWQLWAWGSWHANYWSHRHSVQSIIWFGIQCMHTCMRAWSAIGNLIILA